MVFNCWCFLELTWSKEKGHSTAFYLKHCYSHALHLQSFKLAMTTVSSNDEAAFTHTDGNIAWVKKTKKGDSSQKCQIPTCANYFNKNCHLKSFPFALGFFGIYHEMVIFSYRETLLPFPHHMVLYQLLPVLIVGELE